MNNRYNTSGKTAHSPDTSVIKVHTEKSKLGVLKTLFVVFLILLQIAILSFLYAWLINVFRGYIILSLVLSVISAVVILSSKRNPSSKAVWVFITLVLFIVGFILCILSDERVFFGKSKRKYRKVFANAEKYKQATSVENYGGERTQEDCEYLLHTGGFEPYTNTKMQYFPSGGLLFDNILARIEQAKRFVFIEYFIISDGVLLDRFINILSEKAKKGVDVRIIYDDMGSHSVLSHKVKKRISASGIKLQAFNRLVPVVNLGLNFRDHRKIVVVDGKTAYTGGANLADEYTNETRMFGYWKDAGVRIDGQAVDGFSLIFLRQWEFLTNVSEDYGVFLNLYEKAENTSVAVPYACGLDYDTPVGKEMYLNIIAKTQQRLFIMTPYLVPDESIMNMIINKARSGVDIRIILPGIPDKSYVYMVSVDNAKKLCNAGVKIYFMQDSFVHSKNVLSDYCAVIGSCNFDMRSFYQQFESMLYTDDKSIMKSLEQDFEKTFTLCDRDKFKKDTIISKIIMGVLKIASPLM